MAKLEFSYFQDYSHQLNKKLMLHMHFEIYFFRNFSSVMTVRETFVW